MNYPIVGLFATSGQAADAIKKLTAEGFTSDLITLVDSSAGAGKDKIVAAITAGYVLLAHARVYAEGIAKGQSLVIVRAPFSAGGKATKILAAFKPLEVGIEEPADRAALWDEAAPISSALRIPTLSTGLFSTFWTLPVLTHKDVRLPFPELTQSHSTTRLSSNPTPLSSLFKLPLLLR